jgi:hypothetical protein
MLSLDTILKYSVSFTYKIKPVFNIILESTSTGYQPDWIYNTYLLNVCNNDPVGSWLYRLEQRDD